jgi:hypothetical protein
MTTSLVVVRFLPTAAAVEANAMLLRMCECRLPVSGVRGIGETVGGQASWAGRELRVNHDWVDPAGLIVPVVVGSDPLAASMAATQMGYR